jgi:hypothetical protein
MGVSGLRSLTGRQLIWWMVWLPGFLIPEIERGPLAEFHASLPQARGLFPLRRLGHATSRPYPQIDSRRPRTTICSGRNALRGAEACSIEITIVSTTFQPLPRLYPAGAGIAHRRSALY